MTSSSWASWVYAPGTRSASAGPYRTAAPRRVSSTSQLCSVWPSGTGKSGSRGATSRRSNAQPAASSAARSTTPGHRANLRRCSASVRRQAVAEEGSHPSRSSRVDRARTADNVVASGNRAGVA